MNSISLEFIHKNSSAEDFGKIVASNSKTETAIFAGGCFWEVEYLIKQLFGIISILSGYIGGHTANPTYEEVFTQPTGHAEAIEIIFDPNKVNYETLVKRFFQIHDLEQLDRQGPDEGDQYRSEIFYTTPKQKEIALKLIKVLKEKGFKVVTKLTRATKFWKAEDYNQNYYEKTQKKTLLSFFCKKILKRILI